MRLIRILVAALIVVAIPIVTAAPAAATISGPCTASGVIDGKTYDAKQKSVVIPREGKVNWNGAITTGGSGRRSIEGEVKLDLPPPFSDVVVANGSWDGQSNRYSNKGAYDYDLPSILVGPKFTLYGHHAERGTTVCTGSVDIRLDGSKWTNPILLGSLVLTVLAVLNMSLVIRAKGVRS